MADGSRSPLLVTYCKLSLMTACFGGTFVAGRAVVQAIEPVAIAACRYAIATSCLLLLAWRLEGGLPPLRRKFFLPVVLLGLTGVFGYNLLFFMGLEQVPASRASLIVTTNPIAIALGAALIYREPLTPGRVAGIGLALLGAATAIAEGNPLVLLARGAGTGDLYLIGCIVAWAAYTLAGKYVLQFLSPLAATTYACAIGTPLLFACALPGRADTSWTSVPLSAWAGVGYLGIFGTVLAFLWYYEGVQAIGAARASVFINFVPISAVLAAALLLGEPLTPTLLASAFLVFVGIALVNCRPAASG